MTDDRLERAVRQLPDEARSLLTDFAELLLARNWPARDERGRDERGKMDLSWIGSCAGMADGMSSVELQHEATRLIGDAAEPSNDGSEDRLKLDWAGMLEPSFPGQTGVDLAHEAADLMAASALEGIDPE